MSGEGIPTVQATHPRVRPPKTFTHAVAELLGQIRESTKAVPVVAGDYILLCDEGRLSEGHWDILSELRRELVEVGVHLHLVPVPDMRALQLLEVESAPPVKL